MTRSRYNLEVALNRLLRKMEDKPEASDTQYISGEILNAENAMSDIAELWEGSLPGETLHIPAAGLPFASVTEANEGTSNTVILTPASHTWPHEYGGIYVTTGTIATLVIPPNTWAKITGTFQNEMLNSGTEIDCDWDDDRIIINEVGVYLVMYQLSVMSLGDSVNLDAEVFVNGTGQPQTSSKTYFGLSGTVGSIKTMVGIGTVNVVSGSYPIDIRLKSDIAITTTVASGQLFVERMVG